MIRLAVADFDGTLRPYGQRTVDASVLSEIERMLDAGIHFAVSSGRTYGELKPHFEAFSEKMWFICCDGAYTVCKERVVYERRIAREDLRLFDCMPKGSIAYVLHGVSKNYAVGELPCDAERYAASSVPSGASISEPIYKITAYGTPPRLPPYCGLRSHWDGGAYSMSQYVNRFCNKGTALSDLQTRLMLTKFDTACVGDSGNDIAMMHNAKLSVAVGERCEELRRACTVWADSADHAMRILLRAADLTFV